MDVSTAAVTVRLAVLETEPTVAVITVGPVPTAVARPEVLLMVATEVVPLVHVALAVKS